MLHINKHIRPTSLAAMNSASVEESATVGWNFVLYAIVPPASWMQIPLKERRVLIQEAQSESPYAMAMFASCWGRSSKRRSLKLLLTSGRGPTGRSSRLRVRQK